MTPPQQPPAPKANRLAKEASPYLRQHQHNPVDWWPWGKEALALAKEKDKPIFVSIGYAACHWCHVMAAESFADPAIAALMNEHFVCIKIDREERPDVDEIYMAAVHAMGQRGGWPLSVWLTPDGRPFYGGTYFPPKDGHGRPGFPRVLEQLARAWKERRQEVLDGAGELATHLQKALAPELAPGEPTKELLGNVLPQAERRYDPEYGGFGEAPLWAPKFPSPIELQVLLRLGSDDAAMVTATLHAMRKGGMHDQLGGGFHRYSTDRKWLVPHFEKMLYDNALLASCYADAHVRFGVAEFAGVVRSTLDWLLREMRDSKGGFWSSTDAQSEHVEGKFFVWRKAEVTALLGDDSELLCRHLGITAEGNWEGSNVLTLAADAAALAKATGRDVEEIEAKLAKGKAALLAARDERVRPATDDKVLAAWNGFTIRALADGYRAVGDERYREAARAAADFALRELVGEGRVRRAWHGGKARHDGVLEDYAALADGLLALFEVDGDARWLAAARDLLGAVVKHFRAEDGSLWFTADDAEQLLARTKLPYDTPTPSGQALAAGSFLRCGLLLGDEAMYGHGVAALRANHQVLATAPAAAPALVRALQFHLAEPREIVIAGEPSDPRTRALLRGAWRRFPDHHVVALVHAGNRQALEKLSPVFAGKVPLDGVPAAYVCRRGACDAPITDLGKLEVPR